MRKIPEVIKGRPGDGFDMRLVREGGVHDDAQDANFIG